MRQILFGLSARELTHAAVFVFGTTPMGGKVRFTTVIFGCRVGAGVGLICPIT
jgi:hypothetical protein